MRHPLWVDLPKNKSRQTRRPPLPASQLTSLNVAADSGGAKAWVGSRSKHRSSFTPDSSPSTDVSSFDRLVHLGRSSAAMVWWQSTAFVSPESDARGFEHWAKCSAMTPSTSSQASRVPSGRRWCWRYMPGLGHGMRTSLVLAYRGNSKSNRVQLYFSTINNKSQLICSASCLATSLK